ADNVVHRSRFGAKSWDRLPCRHGRTLLLYAQARRRNTHGPDETCPFHNREEQAQMTTTEERTFELQDLVKQLEKEGGYFLDFLKVRDLEAGIIVLRPGEKDTQEPHSADELYYVIEGSGFIELGKDRRQHPVRKGS